MRQGLATATLFLCFCQGLALTPAANAQSHVFSETDVPAGDEIAEIAACQAWGQGQPDQACLQNAAGWADIASSSTELQAAFGDGFGLYTLSDFQEFGTVDIGYATSHQFHENPQGLVFLNGSTPVLPVPTAGQQLLRDGSMGDAGLILRAHRNAAIDWRAGRLTGYRLSMREGEEQTFVITYPISTEANCPVCPVVGSAVAFYAFGFGQPYFDAGPGFLTVTRSPPIFDPLPVEGAIAAALLQQVLQQAGYNPGPVDGVMGPQTERALISFKLGRCLDPTPFLDGSTREHLSDPLLLGDLCRTYLANPGFETLESAGIVTIPSDSADLFNFPTLLDRTDCETPCVVEANARYRAQVVEMSDALARTAVFVHRLNYDAMRPFATQTHPISIWEREGERAMVLTLDPCPTGAGSCLNGLVLPRDDGLAGYILADIFAPTEALEAALAAGPPRAGGTAGARPDSGGPQSLADCAPIAEAMARLACFDTLAAGAP